MNGKQKFFLLLAVFQVLLVMVVLFSVDGIISFVSAQVQQPSNYDYYSANTAGMLGLGAGIAIGLSTLGAGTALKTTGTAAIASLSEKEEVFFKAFLVVALCEALAIYGLIMAVLLWTKIPSLP